MRQTAPAGVRQLLDSGSSPPRPRAAAALLAGSPEDRDGLYMLAVAQRYQGQIPEALATLARLEDAPSRITRGCTRNGGTATLR